jgi:hypothetical protein
MTESFENLRATSLNPEQHERTCGYWYTVTNGAMAHTAFATRAGLNRWLQERGLSLKTDLPAQGEWGTTAIVGTYRKRAYLYDTDKFEEMLSDLEGSPDYRDRRDRAIATAVLDNANYIDGQIDDELREIPGEIETIWRLARSLDCDYVRLDADGPVDETLPTWDW